MRRQLATLGFLVLAACSGGHHQSTKPPPIRRAFTLPDATPNGIPFSEISTTVAWYPSPTSGITSYRVYRSTVLNQENILIRIVPPNHRWIVDYSPYIPTGNYYYRIRTEKHGAISAKSAPVVANGQKKMTGQP